MGYFPPRQVETTHSCPSCGGKLNISRSCQEVHMSCPHCHKTYPFRDYVKKMDAPMERFMENVYMDRI